VTKSIGYGSDSAHDSGTTRSGINTSNITITDAAGQAATGKTVEQILADIKTDTVTNTVALNSGSIANNFDKEAVQKELDLQVKVTQEFDRNRQAAKAEINTHEQALRDAAEQETDPAKKAKLIEQAKQWQTGGLILDSVAGALYGPNSNGLTGTIAQVAAPHVANAIGDYFKNPANDTGGVGSAEQILAHTILGAALAAATGNNALVGGLAGGGGEGVGLTLSNWLYGQSDPTKLTVEQKSTLSSIIGLVAAGVGGAVGGTTGAVTGATTAQNAVDNNETSNPGYDELTPEQKGLEKEMWDKLASCQTNPNQQCVLNPAVQAMIAMMGGELLVASAPTKAVQVYLQERIASGVIGGAANAGVQYLTNGNKWDDVNLGSASWATLGGFLAPGATLPQTMGIANATNLLDQATNPNATPDSLRNSMVGTNLGAGLGYAVGEGSKSLFNWGIGSYLGNWSSSSGASHAPIFNNVPTLWSTSKYGSNALGAVTSETGNSRTQTIMLQRTNSPAFRDRRSTGSKR
jgi:hypothetical protein